MLIPGSVVNDRHPSRLPVDPLRPAHLVPGRQVDHLPDVTFAVADRPVPGDEMFPIRMFHRVVVALHLDVLRKITAPSGTLTPDGWVTSPRRGNGLPSLSVSIASWSMTIVELARHFPE